MSSLRVPLILAFLGFTSTLQLTGCGDSATPASPLAQALDAFVGHPDGPPGAVGIVQRGDDVQVYAAGIAELSTNRPPTVDDHMRLASVSKAFSGAAALALVSRGDLSLDDTIATRLPDLPPAWGRVTLRDLLRHQSGIEDYSRAKDFGPALAASPKRAPAPRALLDFVADTPLTFPPGTRYRYSNSDNVAVGLMVEAATRTSYANALQALVFDPLRLARTSLPSGPVVPAPTFFGYESDGLVLDDVTELLAAGWLWASGGIVSTPSDANRFVRGYVGGQLVDAAARAEQFTFIDGGSQPPGPGRNSAGLGIFRYDTACGTVYGHTGNVFGYTQLVAATEDGARSVAISVDTQFSESQQPERFEELRRIYELGVCAALQ